MEYLQTAPAQLRLFFYALGFGLLLGALYDGFRFPRLLLRSRVWTVALDLGFVLAAGLLDFCFRLVLDFGRLRLYVLCGQALGWVLHLSTIGRRTVRLQQRLAALLRAAAARIRRPFRTISLRVRRRCRKQKENAKKSGKKQEKNEKPLANQIRNSV